MIKSSTVRMKTPFQVLFLVILLAGAYLAGHWNATGDKAASQPVSARKVLYYTCPMHPQYRSSQPGVSPCCGMRLEPVYADGASPAGERYPPGTVRVSAEKQQLIGVRFAVAEITDGTESLRAVGRIAFDEKEAVVLADLLEHQASRVQVGQAALVSIPFHPEQSFWATVDYVYPRLDTVTRTLKVRLQASETGFKLVPDTFANVDFRIAGPRTLTVPAEAVLNSGLRKAVFVDLGDGYLQPREVETGRRLADRIEIKRGLRKGDRVVASGNFLIDSESQLKLVASGIRTPQAGTSNHDPVCGMEVDPAIAKEHTEHHGLTYYFCSADCKGKFLKAPASYAKETPPASTSRAAAMNMAPPRSEYRREEPAEQSETPRESHDAALQRQAFSQPSAGGYARVGQSSGSTRHKDPVCGKEVDEKNAYRRTVEYRDVVLYFDSQECFQEFMKNPEVYGQKAVPTVILNKPKDQEVITPHTWDQPAQKQGTVKK